MARYTAEETSNLILFYPNMTLHIDRLVTSFNRPRSSIHLKANDLGLSRDPRQVAALPETKSKQSEKAKLRVGSKNPFYGRKHKPETIQAMKQKLSIMFQGTGNPFYGKRHSLETRNHLKLVKHGKKCGKDNPAWRGGYEPYYGPTWNEQRRKALERDNYTCQKCGKKQNGREHEVHHIIARRKFTRKHLAEANALENLITLCINCHRKLIYAGGDD